ncbi:MAG: hypothetical protein KAJ19_08710 [Gammaproteobacteria bacterium]|nr:hypothetical protein [Gammaproteobacteria bacterium]
MTGNGSGRRSATDRVACVRCGGIGYVLILKPPQQVTAGDYFRKVGCQYCDGTGRVDKEAHSE